MRIALLSTSAVPLPPPGYGGTELVTAELAKMLTRLGHDVTVFATGDSSSEANLSWHFPTAQWPPDDLLELRHAASAWRIIASADPSFDVVHAHHPCAIPFGSVCAVPTVLTLHNARDERVVRYLKQFDEVTYVAISRRQADLYPELGVRHVVHHGIDDEVYEVGSGEGGWLAFVGRLAREKGPHIAIDVARATGIALRMGGQAHPQNRAFFESEVAPRLLAAGDLVEWDGEAFFGRKLDMFRGARATLFPIAWEEPFGLVMIESMLVGTPVIAFPRGAAPEVVEDGVTGFLVHDEAEMIEKVRAVGALDRGRCSEVARQRWTSRRMAQDYVGVYEQAIAGASVGRSFLVTDAPRGEAERASR